MHFNLIIVSEIFFSFLVLILVECVSEFEACPVDCRESEFETGFKSSARNDSLTFGNHARALRTENEPPNEIGHRKKGRTVQALGERFDKVLKKQKIKPSKNKPIVVRYKCFVENPATPKNS